MDEREVNNSEPSDGYPYFWENRPSPFDELYEKQVVPFILGENSYIYCDGIDKLIITLGDLGLAVYWGGKEDYGWEYDSSIPSTFSDTFKSKSENISIYPTTNPSTALLSSYDNESNNVYLLLRRPDKKYKKNKRKHRPKNN